MAHDYKIIAVLGDSVADGYYDGCGKGWVGRLEEKLHAVKPCGVGFNNFAVSGDRICDVWHRLGGMVMKNEAEILLIAVGVNDTYRFGGRDAAPCMSMELRRHYWHKTLMLAKRLIPQIYVFGLLPVNEAKIPARTDDFGTPMFYRNDDIEAYNGQIESWCKNLGVSFISFHERFKNAGYAALLDDDVHPDTKGHELISEWAFEELRDSLL